MINLIVATDKNRLIGDGNKLPWSIKEELSYFKNMTNGSVCVMGRKTFESLPKPLKNRTNLVITNGSLDTQHLLYNQQGYDIQTTSILDFIPERYPGKVVWIIGGKTIYEQFLEKGIVDNIYHSEILGDYAGDVYLNPFPKEYKIVGTFRPSESFIVSKYSKL